MSLSLITRFGQSHLVYRVRTASTFIKGVRQTDKYDQLTIVASIQPYVPRETVEEPIGQQRDRHGVRIYTSTELKAVDEKAGKRGDIVVYMGEKYEVRKVDLWQLNKMTLQHYECLAMRVQEELTLE